MADEGDDQRLLDGQRRTPRNYTPGSVPDYGPIYQDGGGAESQGSTKRLMNLAFVALVVVMVSISMILSIYRGATLTHANGGLYFMLGLSLLGFVALEIFMVLFIQRGHLPREKFWFLYVVGGCVILECIFTNILLFH